MSETNNNDALKKSENDDSSVTKPRTVTTKKKWTGGIALLAVVLLVGISVGGYFLFKVTGDKKSFANAVGSTEDNRDASCVLAIKDSHNPILEITLTPSKSETAFNEIETKEIEQAIVEAYNNASGGCDDNFKRWMYGINFIDQSSAKHAVMEDEEQSSISHIFDNEYTLVMRLETMISCDGCAEDEAFASVYPTSFGKRASARRMSALLSADLALSSIAAFIDSSFGTKVARMNLITTMQDNTEIQHASYYQETTTDTPVSAASYYGTKGGKGKGKGKGGAIGSAIASASIAMAGVKGGKTGGYYGGKKGGKAVSAAIENASIAMAGVKGGKKGYYGGKKGYYGGKKGYYGGKKGYYGGKKGGKAVSAAIENAVEMLKGAKGASCGGKGKGFKGGDGDVDCDPPTSPPTSPRVVEAQTPAPFEYTPLPTGQPTPLPTPLPTPRPTPDPTPLVVQAQTPAPFEYTPLPTGRPTPLPTPLPTPRPTPDPTPFPVAEAAIVTPQPTPNPTPDPTPLPTPLPTPDPTPLPTPDPTPLPTSAPTPSPSSAPSESPSDALPSSSPSGAPTPCNEDPCLLKFSNDTNNSCDPLVAKIIEIDSWCGVRWDPWCVITYNDCFQVDCNSTEIDGIAADGNVDRTRVKCPENIEDAITANTLPPQPIADGNVEDASCPGNFPGTGASCEATNLQCYYFYGAVNWVCNCGANPKEFFCKQIEKVD